MANEVYTAHPAIHPTRALAPRPTPELRNKLFGPVTRKSPPPLRTVLLPSSPRTGARHTTLDSGSEWHSIHDVHELVHRPIVALFRAWRHADLLQHIITIDRVYEARFSPQGRALTHAHGNAFDLNGEWNPLDRPRAPSGTTGHIPDEMLDIARRMGWWVGSDWLSPAHKHFELTVLR